MAGNVVVDGGEPPSAIAASTARLLAGVAFVTAVSLVVVSGSAPDPAAPPAPDTTFPDLVDAIDGWRRLDLPGSGPLEALGRDGETVVAGGAGPQVWWSDDGGTSWDRGVLATSSGGSVNGVATQPELSVAGGTLEEETGPRAAIWSSADGTAWVEAGLNRRSGPSGIEGVAAFEGRFVAWGWEGDPRDSSPEGSSLVLTSTDGQRWAPLDLGDEEARVRNVRRAGGRWVAMGSRSGKPALWVSTDLSDWERIATDGMPFGWTMADAYDDGALTANLLDQAGEATWRWRRREDGSWSSMGRPIQAGPISIERGLDSLSGVGHDGLWQADPSWDVVPLEGVVTAAAGDIAVGAFDGQPVAWIRREGELTVAEVAGAPVWEEAAALGGAPLGGPFPLAGGVLVGAGDRWWMVRGGEVEETGGFGGAPVERVDRVGNEWVAAPAMLWTSDGVVWSQRARPWQGLDGGGARIDAVSRPEPGVVVAVGTSDDGLPAAARSVDGGRSWQSVKRLEPSTPIRDIRPTPDGFVGIALEFRGRTRVVQSADGVEWHPYAGAGVAAGDADAVVTEEGDLYLPPSGRTVEAPPTARVDRVAEFPDGSVLVVSGNRLFVGPERWRAVALDPAAGIDGTDVRPLVSDGSVMVVDRNRDRVVIHRFTG